VTRLPPLQAGDEVYATGYGDGVVMKQLPGAKNMYVVDFGGINLVTISRALLRRYQ
jgi:hypothetical protein